MCFQHNKFIDSEHNPYCVHYLIKKIDVTEFAFRNWICYRVLGELNSIAEGFCSLEFYELC